MLSFSWYIHINIVLHVQYIMFPYKGGKRHENTAYSRIPFLQQDRESNTVFPLLTLYTSLMV
jgi:hypothetical protein